MVPRSNYVAFFHLIVIFHHSMAVHYDFMHIGPKELQLRKFTFGGRFIYLYVWNMFLELIYFIMAFINDFYESKDVSEYDRIKFAKFKDFLFASIVFPVACDVGLMFWILFFINPDLVVSSEVHELVPEWFCHMLRTNIVIFVILEMFLIPRKYPCYFCGILGILIFITAYLAWTFVIYFRTNEWTYQVLEKFSWPQRVGFFGFNFFVPVTFYFIGELLNNLMWTPKVKSSKILREQPSLSENSERTSAYTRVTEV